MSSESLLTKPRARVLRGADTVGVRGATMDVDLSAIRAFTAAAGGATTLRDSAEAGREAREQAARVGYEDGFAAGRQEAMQLAQAQVDTANAALHDALAALHAATAALQARQEVAVAEVEQRIADTALAIAEAVVGRELEIAAEPGRDALVRALRLAPERTDAIARLHPDDVDTVGDLAALTTERSITIVADAAVERGGCVLDVGACRIDGQITPALARVREVLGA